MPWKSKAQERWGNSPAGHQALGDKGVDEWNKSSKGKKLPARVGAGKKKKYNYRGKTLLKRAITKLNGKNTKG